MLCFPVFSCKLGPMNNGITNPERHELGVIIAVRSDPASKAFFSYLGYSDKVLL